MKKLILAIMLALCIPRPAHAEQTVMICVQIPGTPQPSCQPVSTNNPLPVTITSGH